MRSTLFKLIGALVLLGSLYFGWQLIQYRSFVSSPLTTGEGEVILQIAAGTPLAGVARQLREMGAIEDERLFRWFVKLRGAATQIQAGEYRISGGMTPRDLLKDMIKGKVVQYSLTLVEGWNYREMMAAVHASPHLVHTLEEASAEQVMARLGHLGEHPEGRFFPDTYHFPKGLSDLEFLRRAYQEMEQRLTTAWEKREEGLPLKTPYEALILASVIEKETGLASERPAIAGVFVRRIKKGMRLQTDPTIIYGLGENFDGNIRHRDLENRNNPYNTYRHGGLPPTPIAMPGAEAIEAALHPASGNALYFVAKGDGSHHFSATLEEHNQAVIKYQRGGKPLPFSSQR